MNESLDARAANLPKWAQGLILFVSGIVIGRVIADVVEKFGIVG